MQNTTIKKLFLVVFGAQFLLNMYYFGKSQGQLRTELLALNSFYKEVKSVDPAQKILVVAQPSQEYESILALLKYLDSKDVAYHSVHALFLLEQADSEPKKEGVLVPKQYDKAFSNNLKNSVISFAKNKITTRFEAPYYVFFGQESYENFIKINNNLHPLPPNISYPVLVKSLN